MLRAWEESAYAAARQGVVCGLSAPVGRQGELPGTPAGFLSSCLLIAEGRVLKAPRCLWVWPTLQFCHLLGVCAFRVAVSSVDWPLGSLRDIRVCSLMSALSDTMDPLPLSLVSVAVASLFPSFYFCLLSHYVKINTIGHVFLIYFASFCLPGGLFRSFTLNVIFGMLGFKSSILFVCVASLPLDSKDLTLPQASSDHPSPPQGGGRASC